jgi:signal transduction histidine kinase
MRAIPFRSDGPQRIVIVRENITQRKRAEALEIKQASLREAVASMEQVLGVVGHELRTPLAGLRAMAEYVLNDAARGTAESETFLHSIHDEVVRMSDTVNNLLEAARLNSGRARWNWSEFALEIPCQDAVGTTLPLIDSAKVTLSADVQPPNLRMLGDGDAIRRLLLNLITNARKHTERGEIKVTVRPAAEGGDQIEIRVSDTGSGIPPEIVCKLGEAFALNSGSVGASHISGTGLGLAICRAIAAAHGGAMRITSRVGEGTTICVMLKANLAGPVVHATPEPLAVNSEDVVPEEAK